MPSEAAVGEAARWLRYAREDYEAAVAAAGEVLSLAEQDLREHGYPR